MLADQAPYPFCACACQRLLAARGTARERGSKRQGGNMNAAVPPPEGLQGAVAVKHRRKGMARVNCRTQACDRPNTRPEGQNHSLRPVDGREGDGSACRGAGRAG